MRGIQLTEFGGPETLVVRDLPDPTPADGEVVFDVLAAGINYADTHQTEDSYLAKQTLPMIPGGEVVVRDEAGGRGPPGGARGGRGGGAPPRRAAGRRRRVRGADRGRPPPAVPGARRCERRRSADDARPG